MLVDYSLAKRTAAGLQLHRLVQGAIRARHTRASTVLQRIGMGDRTAAALSAGDVLAVVLGILAADIPRQVDAPEAWPRWAALLTHVLAATSYLTSLRNQLGQAALKDGALLLHHAGSYLQLRARPADAQSLLEQAVVITAATYGLDHPAFAASLNNLGSVLLDQVEPEQALPLAERALAIVEAAYGPDHLIIARFLDHLASILFDLKDPKRWDVVERSMNIDKTLMAPTTLTQSSTDTGST